MKRRIVTGTLLVLFAAVTLIAASPLLSVIVSGVVASALNCQLDEGNVHPCLYHGHDIGPMLYDFSVFGWFMLVTLPVLFLALLGWISIAIIAVARRRSARSS